MRNALESSWAGSPEMSVLIVARHAAHQEGAYLVIAKG